ncbi:MAG: hypothetical protein JJE35_07355 [Thermoleophilia bacterium]|nr:hypothetical protein [Thermoleophilia bacterium]
MFAAAIAAAEVIDASRDEVKEAPGTAAKSTGKQKRASESTEPATNTVPPATGGVQPGEGSKDPLKGGADASWAEFASSTPSEIGLAVVGIGSAESARTFGSLQSGHAWSSIKVPIVVTLMAEREAQGEELDGEEKALARSALTASDNAAAASLFQRLEEMNGGLEGASRAVSETVSRASGTYTEVATAPPPSGAVSTYGQTNWSLAASAEFFAALNEGCLVGEQETLETLALMSEVIPEQQWGLLAGGFGPGTALTYKAGWGPEGGASGPYLVRQSGIVAGDGGAVAVAMMAIDESGSFEGGVAALGRIAEWLKENLKSPLPAGTSGCG